MSWKVVWYGWCGAFWGMVLTWFVGLDGLVDAVIVVTLAAVGVVMARRELSREASA